MSAQIIKFPTQRVTQRKGNIPVITGPNCKVSYDDVKYLKSKNAREEFEEAKQMLQDCGPDGYVEIISQDAAWLARKEGYSVFLGNSWGPPRISIPINAITVVDLQLSDYDYLNHTGEYKRRCKELRELKREELLEGKKLLGSSRLYYLFNREEVEYQVELFIHANTNWYGVGGYPKRGDKI